MTKLTMVSKCSSIIGHFDDHGGPPVKYEVHHPMQHVQGYSGCHWTPPLGDYSLRIAPAAARATANETTAKKCTKKTDHFDGCSGVPVQYRMHCPIEEVWGFVRCH
jgi:hypothetical protein